MAEQFYTPDELAGLLKVTRQAIYNWIHDGRLEAVRFGRSVRIPAAVAERLMREGESPIVAYARQIESGLLRTYPQLNASVRGYEDPNPLGGWPFLRVAIRDPEGNPRLLVTVNIKRGVPTDEETIARDIDFIGRESERSLKNVDEGRHPDDFGFGRSLTF